jgi:hypothetical protein
MTAWIFKRIGWKFFAAGAATAVVGGSLVRPALVAVVKAGMGVQHMASSAWDQAKQETASLVAEASRQRATNQSTDAASLAREVRQLREDLASLKSAFTPKS